MVLRSKAQKQSIIRSKQGNTKQESPSSTTSPGVGSEKKRSKVSCLELILHKFFYKLSSCLHYMCVDFGTDDNAKIKAQSC